MRSFIASALLLLASVAAFGQGGNVIRQVVSGTVANGGTGQVIPNANVIVCTSTATGTPCSPLAPNVYSNVALTSPISNPFAADMNGFYSIFLPTGSYIIQESAPVGAGYTYNESFLVFVNGTGTVSSVALTLPTSVFAVSGSPITSLGTLAGAFIAQSANQVFGNCTGSSAVPAFCSLTSSMIPGTLGSTTISGTLTTTSSGNTSIGGTLGVTGAATLSAGGSLTGTFTGSPTLSGNPVFSGTPSFTNGAAFAGTFTGTPTFNNAVTFSGNPVFTGTPSFDQIDVGGISNGGFGVVGQCLTSVPTNVTAYSSICQSGQTATAAIGSGAGAGASVTLTTGSRDKAGLITLVTGSSTSTGNLFTITFSVSSPVSFATTSFCQLFPINANAAAATISAALTMATGSQYNFSVNQSSTVLAGTTTYEWTYLCNGY